MSIIDDVKVRTYEVAKAELQSLMNQRDALHADLDKCDAAIFDKQSEVTAMSTGFKSSIDAAAVVVKEVL